MRNYQETTVWHDWPCDTCSKIIRRTDWMIEHRIGRFCSLQCKYDYGLIQLSRRFGEVAKGIDIGLSIGTRYVKHRCIDCGKERWVGVKCGQLSSERCLKCSRVHVGTIQRADPRERRCCKSNGYLMVRININDPYWPMVNRMGLSPGKNGYVMEHRLIVAKNLGRCLTLDEVVHHLNGIRDDNRLANLVLLSDMQHRHFIPALQKRIQQLEAMLRKQGQLV